jgi:hypothetical protein
MVFGYSARFRRGFRAGLTKWATVGALVFGVVAARAASIEVLVRELHGNHLLLVVAEFCAAA